MVRPIFDGDVLRACEIALEVDDFEILDVEWEQIGLLLVNDRIFFSYFDAWINLPNLLFV